MAQTKPLGLFAANGDTAWSYKTAIKMGLPAIFDTNVSIHFRIWYDIQVVDIEVLKTGRYKGVLANYTTSINNSKREKKRNKPPKFYFTKTAIDTLSVKRIVNLFQLLSIKDIPTEDSLKGKKYIIFDGTWYAIEYCDMKTYTLKSYNNPCWQTELQGTKEICSLVDSISKMICLDFNFRQFIDTLPSGCYHEMGIACVCIQKNW